MNAERLVQMANDIGDFFKSEPVREDAVAGIADHLRRFWTPRMRAQLAEHLRQGGEGLEEMLAEAVRRLAA
ncbi:MAG: formate dehydrogenase subunit delta [Nevskia sp.]|nr:formate dehydrogenase subunit delta [Nevskia sp.]